MPVVLRLPPGLTIVRLDQRPVAFSRYTGETDFDTIARATEGYLAAPELDGAATLVADLRRSSFVLDASEVAPLYALTVRLATRARRFGVLDHRGSDRYVLHALFAVKATPLFDAYQVFDDPRAAEGWAGLPDGALDAPLPD